MERFIKHKLKGRRRDVKMADTFFGFETSFPKVVRFKDLKSVSNET